MLLILLATALQSCKKEDGGGCTNCPSDNVTSMEELVVPNSFNFRTTEMVSYNFSMVNASLTGKYKLEVYDFIPTAGGRLISSAVMDPNGQVNGDLAVPAAQDKIYVMLEAPDASRSLHILPVSASIAYNFNAGKKGGKKTSVVSPNCSSGCGQTYNNHSGNLNLNGNNVPSVVCLTGSFSGSINANSSTTIRVCTDATFQNVNLNNGSSMEIVDGVTVTFQSLNLNSTSGQITIYDADVTFNSSIGLNGKMTNYGRVDVTGNFNVNGQGECVNSGTITTTQAFNNNNETTNNNKIYAGTNFHNNGSADLYNYCLISATQDFHQNNDLFNHGFIEAGDDIFYNGGGTTNMYDGAMMEGADAQVNGNIIGNGTTSLIKISGTTNINGGANISGNMEFCDLNGVESLNGTISSPAVLACNVYLPTSNCNTSGNGTPAIIDTDNDGVADSNDEYPNDPNRASNSYYPAQSQYGSLAFEDLWPARGDYDFNDLVVDYNYQLVLNANNEVVDIIGKFRVEAIGGFFKNGFGIQFDFAPSVVASASGAVLSESYITNSNNGTESGQSKATVIVFDNAATLLPNPGTPFVNTEIGDAYVNPDSVTLTINLSTPQSLNALGSYPFNPFLIVDMDRGKEVHLADYAPTDLANANFFGTGSDDTQVGAGRYYKSSTNLPWALNLISGFDYPVEKEDIVGVYLNFAGWAQSGGANSNDWYQDFPGYRTDSKVYE